MSTSSIFAFLGDYEYGLVEGIPAAKQSVLTDLSNLYIVTESGYLYTAGTADALLCRDGETGTDEQTNLAIVPNLTQVKKVAAAYESVGVITEDGTLRIAGTKNDEYQLGKASAGELSIIPNMLAKDVSFGIDHTAVIDTDNNLWVAGKNQYGQLCESFITTDNPIVTNGYFYKINNIKAKAVSCGQYHTVVLLQNGQVWTAGDNSSKQLCRDVNTGNVNTSNFGQVIFPTVQ